MNNFDILKLRDHKFYLENFCRIKTKEHGVQPFILNEPQKDLFNTLNKNNKVIVLKSRQMGFSTAVAGYFYVDAITNPGFNVALIGYNQDLVRELFEKIKIFYKSTPPQIRPKVLYDTKDQLSFPNMDSKIMVLPCTKDVGRGYTLQRVLLTELSAWEDAEFKYQGLIDSVTPNGKVIIESCVTGDTIVFTNEGLKYVKDIHDWNNYSLGFSCGNNIEIDGHYGLKPTNTYYNSGVQKGYRIKTQYGYELGMSSVHKLFVLRKDKLEFISANDLKIGDYVPLKYGQNIWGNKNVISWKPTPYSGFNKQKIKLFNPQIMTKDLAYLLGLILGDGSIYKNKSVTITTADKDIVDFLLNNPFGLKFYFQKGSDYAWRCTNQSFVDFLTWLGMNGHKAREKTVPKFIMGCSKDIVANFLSGLFDTDGWSKSKDGMVGFCSTSKDIIEVVKMLLLNFGIISSTYEYTAKPTKKVKVYSHGYRIELNGYFSNIFYKNIGFRIKRKHKNFYNLSSNLVFRNVIPHVGKLIKEKMAELDFRHSDIRGDNGENRISNKSIYSNDGNIWANTLKVILDKSRNKNGNLYKNLKQLLDYNYCYLKIINKNEIEENVYDFTVDDGHTVTYSGFVGHQTPRGVGNLYHRLWMTDNEYVKKQYDWWWGYSQEQMDAKKKEKGQMWWDQEFGCCFLTTGRSVFSADTIALQRKNIRNIGEVNQAIKLDDYEVVEQKVRQEDYWTIYRDPNERGIYAIGADVADGVQGGDYSAATVFDRKTGEEVAMFHHQLPPDIFAKELDKIGRRYNNALIAVETNGQGGSTAIKLRDLLYPSLYFRPAKFETMGMTLTDRIGWRTNSVTRPILINEFNAAVRENALIIHSKKIVDEMSVFIYDDNGRETAQQGYHDDLIFSTAIAHQSFKVLYSGKLEQINYEKYMPKNYSY